MDLGSDEPTSNPNERFHAENVQENGGRVNWRAESEGQVLQRKRDRRK